MNILIVNPGKLPAINYGGTERVIWGLGKALHSLGHNVFYLVAKGSSCPFAEKMLVLDENTDLNKQIPEEIDVVHLNYQPTSPLNKPYITTFHGNINSPFSFDRNTVFISQNQATRYHGSTYVHNGLAWDEYPKPDFTTKRNYFHFLGDAAWKVKNVKGAIAISKMAHEELVVVGGNRLNFNMGFRFTLDWHVKFKGKLNNYKKSQIMAQSKGLIFPVLWHEPFGLAIVESLYFGCPVFGTTFGSLPELVTSDVGFLSNSMHELAAALPDAHNFSAKYCSDYATSCFDSFSMTKKYLTLYEKVLNNEYLHKDQPFLPAQEVLKTKRFLMDA